MESIIPKIYSRLPLNSQEILSLSSPGPLLPEGIQLYLRTHNNYVLVHTWLTTQRCLAGSFDTIWQFQNITTSVSESVNGERPLPAKSLLLRSAALAVSLLASSVLPRCRCTLCLVNHCLLSETDSSILYRTKVARAGCMRARVGQGPTRNLRAGPLQMHYRQIYIYSRTSSDSTSTLHD